MFADLFGGEVFIVPLVDVIYCLVEERFVSINLCDVEGSIGGVLWGRDGMGCRSGRHF